MSITVGAAMAAAGADPFARAEQVMSANPGEIHALAEGFAIAAGEISQSLQLGDSAALAAAGAGTIEDATPLDLMAEVLGTVASVTDSPARLQLIAATLSDLAAGIPSSQTACQAALDALVHAVVAIDADYAVAQSATADNLHPGFLQAAADTVLQADAQVAQIVTEHEAKVAAALRQLHGAGYVLPESVDPGGDGVTSLPLVPCFTDAEAAAAWWASLSFAEQDALIESAPADLALIHGLPAAVLNVVNRRLLTDDAVLVADAEAEGDQHSDAIDDLRAHLATTAGYYANADYYLDAWIEADASAIMANPHAWDPVTVALAGRVLATSVDPGRVAKVQQQVAGDERYLLEYDAGPEQDGTAVIALGNPDAADNVAVLVPGTGNDIATLGGQVGNGEAVLEVMEQVAPGESHSVIVYQGYDTPDDLLQATDEAHAVEGGAALAADLAGYAAANPGDEHLTVVGHSYGSTVAGAALLTDDTLPVDDVVLIGSPGVLAADAAELGVDPGRIYVGAAFLDPITGPIAGSTHGTTVTTDEFGAILLETGDATGHSAYYDDNESLLNIGRISAGEYDEVTIIEAPLGSIAVPVGG